MNKPMRLTNSAVSALDLLAHPVWVFSLETLRILTANQAAQNWLGFSSAELQERTIADLRPADEKERLREHLESFTGAAADGGMWTVIAKSGARHRVSFHWRRVSLQGADAVLATISDKTEILEARQTSDFLEIQIDELKEKSALSELSFRKLFECAPGKMIVVTPATHAIVAVTDEYARATMVNPEEIYGRSLFDVFPDNPEDLAADGVSRLRASMARVEALSTTDIMGVQKYPIRRRDGTFEIRYWLPVNKPVHDEAGSLLYIIHSVEDISELVSSKSNTLADSAFSGASNISLILRMNELRSTLTALQEQEARLRTAKRLLGLGAWEYDVETSTLNWSPRAFEIYGVPEQYGPPSFDDYVQLVHPHDRQRVLEIYRNFEQTDDHEIVFQHRIVRGDGSIAHVKGVGERHSIDNREIVVGFVQDMSEIVASKSKLAEMFRLQRIAGQMTKLGSWRVELDPPRLTWSPETAEIHEEPSGFSPAFEHAIDYYVPECREQIRSAFSACAETGRPFDETLQLITAKGNRVWVRAMGEAVKARSGKVIAVEGAFQNISELVTARDEADMLARRLYHTLESISDAFFLVDDAWRFVFINSQAEVLLQRQRSQLVGKVVWDEFPEAVSSTFQYEYERAVRNKVSVRFEEYFEPLEAWFQVDAYPTSEGLAVYFRDITKERVRDEHLRLLEAAVSRQNDILLITKAEPIDGRDAPEIVYVNDAFVKRTGYSREEVIGRSPRILQGPKTQRSELNRIREALEQWQPVRSELINYTKSGEEFWLELDIVPLANDKGWFTHWVAVERDITDRKRVQEAMQINDERFRLVARATNDVIWDWDLVSDTVWWNENLKALCGFDPSEVEPGPESWLNRVHPDDRQAVLDSIEAVIRGGGIYWSSEYRFLHRNGHSETVVDRGFVIRSDEGKPVRMLGSMRSITRRLDLENKLRQAQKLEAIGQLTGGVAHDFNNLLTVILGNSEILYDELEDHSRLRAMAKISMTAAERGAELTERLLAFARKQALEPTLVDLSRLVAGMETLLRRTLGERIDIELIRESRPWNVEVDPGQLETALLNLAINARDAMPEGGRLAIETANCDIDTTSAADIEPGQYVLLTVTDTGHGIPDEYLDQVFEPFFTTKDVGKGSGLGLSMVYGFVKQTGGHIRLHSEPAKGTSIKLYFPRSHASERATQIPRTTVPASGGIERILVVEDDNHVRDHLVNQLRSLGYQVSSTASGVDALDMLRNNGHFDLLLTDVIMPGINGKELADRAMEIYPRLKVLFTSGYPEDVIVSNGRLNAGVELLSKPFKRTQIAEKVRRALGK